MSEVQDNAEITVDVKKTWVSAEFIATKKGSNKNAVVSLEYNRHTKKINLTTVGEEGVSFKHDDIETAELKLEALTMAIKFLKTL